MGEKFTQWWRCRGCRKVGYRDEWTTRRGILECGTCLHQHQAVGLLEPVADLRRFSVHRAGLAMRFVEFVCEVEAPDLRHAERYANATESCDPRLERLEVKELPPSTSGRNET
jgi:hypothetical protein